MRLLALGMFPLHPFALGGSIRALNLLREVVRSGVSVEYVYPIFERRDGTENSIVEGIAQKGVPVENALAEESVSRARMGVSVADVLLARRAAEQHRLRAHVEKALTTADRVLCIQPYLYPFVRDCGKPVLLDCHDVEQDVKRKSLELDPWGERERAFLEELEREAVHAATFVFATTREDSARLAYLYGVDATRVRLLPNGCGTVVSSRSSRWMRWRTKRKLGLSARLPVALFFSSSHPPNVRVAHAILDKAALYLPSVTFLFAGSVASALRGRMLPFNTALIPETDAPKRALIYAASDLGLNSPYENLPGSDLKVLDYLAAGVPVVATALGVRGHGLVAGQHYHPAEPDLPSGIMRVLGDREYQHGLSEHGRAKAQELSWARIAPTLLSALHEASEAEPHAGVQRTCGVQPHGNRRTANREHALTEFRFGVSCVRSTPVQISIELTNDCHCRCLHCFRSYHEFTPSYLSPAALTRIPGHFLDNAEQIDLSNDGESMIHPAWDQVLETIADSGRRHVTFNTSLTPATPERLRRMVELGCGVTVSVDGATKETYESIRRGASYDHLLQSLRLLRQYAKETAHPDFSLAVNWVLYEQNLSELASFSEMAAEFGVAAINILALAPHHEEIKAYCCDPNAPSTEERLLRALETATENGVILNPPYHLIRSESIRAAVEANQRACATSKPPCSFWHHHPDPEGCSFPWTQLTINSAGKVIGCCFSDPCMGDLMTTDLEEIWHNHLFAEWRTELNRNEVHRLCVESNSGGNCCPRVQYLKNDNNKSHFLQ
jgi:MoaA/NifB/PqqE/SkfB family radical SAM enzyme/glycosyltransferase involved in cell wall biosynthesis